MYAARPTHSGISFPRLLRGRAKGEHVVQRYGIAAGKRRARSVTSGSHGIADREESMEANSLHVLPCTSCSS